MSFLCVEIIYGLSVAAYVIVLPILLVDMFGVDVLATTFGLIQLFRGIGCILGPLVCGFLYDKTKSYVSAFVIAGSLFILGGTLTGFVWTLNKKQSKNEKYENNNWSVIT